MREQTVAHRAPPCHVFAGCRCLILRFAVPVLTLLPPVLQNNRKVPGPPCNCRGSLSNLRWSIDLSRLKACYLLNFAKNSLFSGKTRRDRFAYDCAHHHPVRPNHGFPDRLQIGRFCGDIRRCRSGFSVSPDISRLLGQFLASRLCIQKFRSRRPDFKRRMICSAARKLGHSGDKGSFAPCPHLLRIEPERVELPAPFRRGIAKSLYTDPAGQTTFYRCSDEIRREEGERNGHVDLTHAAFLTCCDLLNVSDIARHNLVKPTTAASDCAHETSTTVDPRRTNFIFRDAARDKTRV